MRTLHRLILFVFCLVGLLAAQNAKVLSPKIVWNFAERDSVSIRPGGDWSAYNAIEFDAILSCDLATPDVPLVRPSIIFPSEDPQQPGMDYFMVSLPASSQGKHHIILPFDEIARTRHPVGWNKIDFLQFHADWSGQKRHNKDVTLTLENIRLFTLPPEENARGPRLTDDDFFALLDLSRPELAAVKAALDRQDTAAAKHTLAEYIRHRETPRWTASWRDRPTLGHAPITRRPVKGEGGSFENASIPLDWTGWKHLEIPVDSFLPRGKPCGKDLISGLRFQWLASASCPPDAALNLDDVQLVADDGSIKNLGDFEQLATGWHNVRQDTALAHGGKASGVWQFPTTYSTIDCLKCPVDWTRARTLSFWLHVSHPKTGRLQLRLASTAPDTTAADAILAHKFAIGSFKKQVVDFGPRIDWSVNPMDKGETKTVEWNAVLNRCFHFAILHRAYWSTGDDAYARELAQEINGWIEDNPVLLTRSGNGPYHYAWETLNTGIRLHQTWPEAFFRCLDSPSFTDDIIVNFMKSTVEHARHLMRWPSKGNWLTAESWGVYTAGLIFPEFKDAATWRQHGIRKLHAQLTEEVYPDGVQYELALGYNNWTADEFQGAYDLAVLNNLQDEFPADYPLLLEKMSAYLMKISMPNGQAFALNDGNNASVIGRLLTGYQRFPKRRDFLHAAFAGNDAFPKPARESFPLHWAGHYVMRSAWTKDGNVMLMDAGPWGKGHQHQDKLSLALYANGRLLLPDGGVTMYDASRWRTYTLLTRAHNSVLIDHMDQFNGRLPYFWKLPWTGERPAESDSQWLSTPHGDVVQGWFKGQYMEYPRPEGGPRTTQEGLRHRRTVTFIKPQLWVVHDTLFANDDREHTADILYHINAATAVQSAAPCLNITATTPNDAGLNIAFAPAEQQTCDIVTGKTDIPVQGWSSIVRGNRPEGVPMSPVPTAVVTQTWRSRGDAISVLRPLRKDETVATKVERLPAKDGITAVHITVSDTESYEWQYDETNGTIAVTSLGKTPTTLLRFAGLTEPHDRQSWSLRPLAPGCLVAASSLNAPLAVPASYLPSSAAVYKLDRNSRRLATVAAKLQNGTLTWQAEADVEYEITDGQAPSAETLRSQHVATNSLKDVPVKPLAPRGFAPAGTVVTVQAETPSGEGGGHIVITDKKIGADGKAFLHWDYPGHWLEYTFDIPADGAYELRLKYCLQGLPALRAVILDGAFPAEHLAEIEIHETGGWSSDSNDWEWFTVPAPNEKPFHFNLTRGRHTLRLFNLGNSMNMDALQFVAVQTP